MIKAAGCVQLAAGIDPPPGASPPTKYGDMSSRETGLGRGGGGGGGAKAVKPPQRCCGGGAGPWVRFGPPRTSLWGCGPGPSPATPTPSPAGPPAPLFTGVKYKTQLFDTFKRHVVQERRRSADGHFRTLIRLLSPVGKKSVPITKKKQ